MIELIGISKSFSGRPVLRNVNLKVEDGESVVIIGRSGSGKSVTLRHILGLLEPDSGRVIVDGKDVNEMSKSELFELRRGMGMLFQNSALWDSMNVEDNIALALRHHKMMPETEIKERVSECLSMVGLDEIGLKYPAELSGGMRKRVGLARAIATQPKYMLYDEPTTGLDPIMAAIIDRLISDLNHQMHTTSVTITHDMNSAFQIADRIVMLHRGEFIFSGTPREVQDTDMPVVRQLVHGEAEGPICPIHTDHYEKTLAHH